MNLFKRFQDFISSVNAVIKIDLQLNIGFVLRIGFCMYVCWCESCIHDFLIILQLQN